MVYQYAVPKALEQYHGVEFSGRVVYPDGQVGIPVSAVGQKFTERLGSLIRILAAETPARRVPSAQECAFCDITKADCPDRVVGEARGKEQRTISEQCQINMGPTSDFIVSLVATAADTCPLMESACPSRVVGTNTGDRQGRRKRWKP